MDEGGWFWLRSGEGCACKGSAESLRAGGDRAGALAGSVLVGRAGWFCTGRKPNSPIDGRFVVACDSICVDSAVVEAGAVAVDADNAGVAGLKNEGRGTVGCAGCESPAVDVDDKLKLKGLLACVAAGWESDNDNKGALVAEAGRLH